MSENVENRRDRFMRLATKRTNEVLRRIRILGNCSNKSVYAYTEKDIQKIFSAIEAELRDAKTRFASNKKNTKQFKL